MGSTMRQLTKPRVGSDEDRAQTDPKTSYENPNRSRGTTLKLVDVTQEHSDDDIHTASAKNASATMVEDGLKRLSTSSFEIRFPAATTTNNL